MNQDRMIQRQCPERGGGIGNGDRACEIRGISRKAIRAFVLIGIDNDGQGICGEQRQVADHDAEVVLRFAVGDVEDQIRAGRIHSARAGQRDLFRRSDGSAERGSCLQRNG